MRHDENEKRLKALFIPTHAPVLAQGQAGMPDLPITAYRQPTTTSFPPPPAALEDTEAPEGNWKRISFTPNSTPFTLRPPL